MPQLQEILDKDATAGDWIEHFTKSSDPRFTGKSKAKRREMAIAAYSARQHRESIDDTEEHNDLLEALRSKKSYADMHSQIASIKDSTFNNAASDILHDIPDADAQTHDYARHSVLFDNRLSDSHLNAIGDHVARLGKTTNTLDKNFHKNVNSVSTLRAALRSNSLDMVNDAKKALTADHKHAILSHGTDAEKSFVFHHGLANKSQISHAIENGAAGEKEAAINHLRALKDSGSTKHADLIAKHLPDDSTTSNAPDIGATLDHSAVPKKQSFLSRIKDKFTTALGSNNQYAPQKRIDPIISMSSMKALKMEQLEELFTAIADGNLVAAQEQLKQSLAAKVSETMEAMKQEIAQGMFQEARTNYASGDWHVTDELNGGVHSTHKLPRKAQDVADKLNAADYAANKDVPGRSSGNLFHNRYGTAAASSYKGSTTKCSEGTDPLDNSPKNFAHYYGSKAKGFSVRITDSMQPTGGTVHPVAGKSEAKKIAKAHNATQWNF